jgi:hypothetical protein
MADDQNGIQSLIPSASPAAALGVDYDEMLASGDPAGYMAAKRAGLEYKAPNVTLAPQTVDPSALIAGAMGKPQAAVAPASQPAPAAGTAAQQPAAPSIARNDATYGFSLDNKNPMEGFGTSLAAGSAPTTDKTGAPTVPGTVTPTGTPDDPNQKILQQSSEMAMANAKNLSGQPTEMQTLAPFEKERAGLMSPQSAANPNGVPSPMAPQYRPTGWQRFGRGLRAVGMGVAEHGIAGGLLGGLDPAAVGATPYGAPNRAFSTAQAQNTQAQTRVGSQEATAERAFTADTARAKDVITSINDIGRNAAAGQNAAARTETAAARADTARVAGQLADIKQQVADYQGQGKTPTTFEATSAAWALEKDPAKKAALKAALDYDRETEIRKFQYKPEDGEAHSAFRQSMIDSATEQIKALQDKYTYNAKRNQYVNPNNPNDVLNPSEYTDKKNEIASKLDQQLGQKKMKPLRVRFDPADAGAGKPTGRAAQQSAATAPAAAPATTPQAKRPAPPTPTTPPPDGAADMALGSDGQYHYRDAGKKDLGVVK